MSAKHTPGPWINLGQGDIVARSDKYCGGEKDIASVFLTTNDEDESNARLIAAAPDLLAALQEMVEVNDEPCRIDHKGFCQSHYLDHVDDGGCRVANAKAAIAKATGETE